MNRRTVVYALSMMILAMMCSLSALGQEVENREKSKGWAARKQLAEGRAAGQPLGADLQPIGVEAQGLAIVSDGLRLIAVTPIERAKEIRRRALVGAWYVNIPQSETGLPPFNALQVFHDGGTFTEVSDLLATLTETPAMGVWDIDPVDKYLLTFQLFVFDENRAPVGMVRVRCRITLINLNEFSAEGVVDFIDPDGNVILAIDKTPFTGKRIHSLPVN